MRFRREFFYVTGKIALQRIKSPADIAPLFFWQSSQLLSGFFFDLKPVGHRSFFGNRLTQIAVEPRAGSNSRYSRESRVEHVGTLRSFPHFKNKNALRFNHELTRIDTISGGTTSVSSHYFPGWDSARPSK